MTIGPQKYPPRRRRGLRIAATTLGLTLALLWLGALIFWFRSSSGEPLISPPLPSPNGFDDVLKAGRAIDKAYPVVNNSVLDADTAETPALRDYVEKNKEALALIRQGLDREFQAPVTYDMDIMVREMNDAGVIRTRSGRTLYAEGVLARRDGRFADSSRAFVDLLRLGAAMSRKVPLMAYLASLAPQTLGVMGLRELRGDLDADQLRALVTILKKLDDDREPIKDVTGRELAFVNQNISKSGIWMSTALTLSGNARATRRQVVDQLAQAENHARVTQRLLIADLAVQLYFKEHGKYPTTLDAVTPILPTDPYSPTNRPFVYRLSEGEIGYQLYSVGPDGDDDRLDPPLGKRFTEKSNGDFTLDSR